ncbi:hypothetical protein BUALT_BualtUnG0012200 [Buddleja alternifolia]|uniref:Uncharacterized protein n=1 Tax=Buddleja alternifolia TaxID=168488 RepID=A0AAV6W5J0_9LAMI|nr:hypothetical protein BUALT_BualtUnG0012200 [Buddleja alternifolia]
MCLRIAIHNMMFCLAKWSVEFDQSLEGNSRWARGSAGDNFQMVLGHGGNALRIRLFKASVVDKYKRPLPKLRNTTPDSGRYEERPAPPGTLNVAQVRQIILLHQGKSDEHDGPMDVPQIAERFRINAAQVQNILQFMALPPEDDSKTKNNQE